MPGDTLYRNVALLIRGEPYPVEENLPQQGISGRNASGSVDLAAFYESELRASSPTSAYESAAVMRFASGRYLQVDYSARLNLRDTDFTVEGWARVNAGAAGGMSLVDFRGSAASFAASWEIGLNATTRGFFVYDGAQTATTTHWTGDNSLPVNGTWFHWAVVRSAGIVTVFIDGTPRVSGALNVPVTHATGARIGQRHDSGAAFLGVMDDIRITRAARYAGAFTPPAVVFPERDPFWATVVALLEASEGLVDLSPSPGAWTVTGSGISLEGDAVVLEPGTHLSMTKAGLTVGGGGDGGKPATYSIEWEMEVIGAVAGTTSVVQLGAEQAGRMDLRLVDGRPYLDVFNQGGQWMAPGAVTGGWHKYAIAVDNWEGAFGVLRFFIDGALVGTTSSFSWDKRGNSNLLQVGPKTASSPSNATLKFRRLRMTGSGAANDSGRAPNAGYTPRPGPYLRNPANTDPHFASTLLIAPLNDGTFNDRSPFARSPSTATNIEADWNNYRSGVNALNSASGSQLVYSAGAEYSLGTGDFTIEAWVRPTAVGGSPRVIVAKYTTWPTSVDLLLEIGTTGKFQFYAGNGPLISLVSDALAPVNVWTHIAVVRQNGVTGMFVDGRAQAQTHQGSASIAHGKTAIAIGSSGAGSDYFLGGISDVRITKAVARYAVSYTPPPSLPNAPHGDPLFADVGLLLQAAGGGFADRSPTGAAVAGAIFDASDTTLRRNTKPVRMRTGDPTVTIASNAAQNLGTADFTIEFWFRLGAPLAATQTLVSRSSGLFGGGWEITCWEDMAGKRVRFQSDGMSLVPAVLDSSYLSTITSADGWYFVSVQRRAGSTYLHVNGKFMASVASTENLSGEHDVQIGPGEFYLHDLRITKGTARYGITQLTHVPAAEADAFLDVTLFTPAAWVPSTSFGAGTVRNQQRPEGFASTTFGEHVATMSYALHATGFSSTAFGAPVVTVSLAASSIAPATAFGQPRTARSVQATATASTAAFGLPAVDLTSRASVPGKASGLEFGEPYVVVGLNLGAQRRAAGWGPVAALGEPAVGLAFAAGASGASTTVLPVPRLRLGLPALAGVAPTVAFGAASAGRASSTPGISSTAFGAPAARVAGLPAGLARTAIGVPRARAKVSCPASSIAGTVFGAPTRPVTLRLRSAVFRTGFGLAQVERP